VLELMTAARETELGAEEQPVLVISADGVSRAGVYCALSFVRDQAGMLTNLYRHGQQNSVK
jgi:hypothetical protein